MAASFFFYDLETSGFNPRAARIVQFAGQRTDMNLKPVGEPLNLLIKLTPDILPEPDAVLITGITPQKTLAEGISEAEFLKVFYEEVVRPETIFVGFNNIRFDDEFMRFLHYRNFYDAYEWQWKDSSSRWDILDVVRMTRALRPEGIAWPFDPEGKPTNRLEFLTKVNKLSHEAAHDALSDVWATIDVAKLVHAKQKDLFSYLLTMRDKKKVAALVEKGEPFVYTSSHYSSDYLHTSAAILLARHPQDGAALVYDLRHDPTPFLTMSVDQLAEVWRFTKDPEILRLPVKTLKYNRAPAVAPLGVINDTATLKRLNLSLEDVKKHLGMLKKHQVEFADKVLRAVTQLDEVRNKEQVSLVDNPLTVDSRLYEKFIDNQDKQAMSKVRAATPDQLSSLVDNFHDQRLQQLLPLYKARNYPASLSPDEQSSWGSFCQAQLLEGGSSSRLAKYAARLQKLKSQKLTRAQQYLLEELQLYAESIAPLE